MIAIILTAIVVIIVLGMLIAIRIGDVIACIGVKQTRRVTVVLAVMLLLLIGVLSELLGIDSSSWSGR